MSVWNEIDAFTQAYVDAMLWATSDNSDDQGGEPLDKNYSIDDIAESAMEKIVADCKRFQEENAADIATIPYRRTNDGNWSGKEQAGHDFWLTRNGHGTGFWDREYLDDDVAKRLTSASHKFGEVYPCVGDNGLIYCE